MQVLAVQLQLYTHSTDQQSTFHMDSGYITTAITGTAQLASVTAAMLEPLACTDTSLDNTL